MSPWWLKDDEADEKQAHAYEQGMKLVLVIWLFLIIEFCQHLHPLSVSCKSVTEKIMLIAHLLVHALNKKAFWMRMTNCLLFTLDTNILTHSYWNIFIIDGIRHERHHYRVRVGNSYNQFYWLISSNLLNQSSAGKLILIKVSARQ